MAGFPIRNAAELMDADFEARWSARETIGGGPIAILRLDVPALDTDEVASAVAEFDRADLIAVRDGAIVLAYPFASVPTGFAARFADGAERYACCAIDALGIAAMLGAPIVGGSPRRRARESVRRALTHAELLPVGRSRRTVVEGHADRGRRRHPGRSVRAGRRDLR